MALFQKYQLPDNLGPQFKVYSPSPLQVRQSMAIRQSEKIYGGKGALRVRHSHNSMRSNKNKLPSQIHQNESLDGSSANKGGMVIDLQINTDKNSRQAERSKKKQETAGDLDSGASPQNSPLVETAKNSVVGEGLKNSSAGEQDEAEVVFQDARENQIVPHTAGDAYGG